MSSSIKLDLGLQSAYDELFMNEQGRADNQLQIIYDIPLSEIDEFPNHPYQVRMDEDMTQLVESVKERGIITPVILRKKEDGRYEMVSGHRRMKASELAGLETVKADVQDLTRDEAIILMVESNLQRSTILPSEKAAAHKMRLEAMKRQGQRTDLTSRPVVGKLQGQEAADVLGEAVGESGRQIQRYIRLNELVPGLVNMVDEGRIAMRPAVELSYLSERAGRFARKYLLRMRKTQQAIHAILCTERGGKENAVIPGTQKLRTGQSEERHVMCVMLSIVHCFHSLLFYTILLKLLGDAMPLGFEQDSLHSGFLARGAQKLNSRKDDPAQCAADIQMAQFRAECVVDDHAAAAVAVPIILWKIQFTYKTDHIPPGACFLLYGLCIVEAKQ